MNSRLWFWGPALAVLMSACNPAGHVMIDLGDVDDYSEFLEDRDAKNAPEPFKANPLYVSAVGKVKAVPDIAVITARVSAKYLNESKAVNEVAEMINTVQERLKSKDIETGFTQLGSQVKRDEACQNANHLAQIRYSQIQSDYWFNKQLDTRGDKDTERRKIKPRLAKEVCEVTNIEVSSDMIIRVKPASEAGAVLQALGDAKISTARLFGYDFSNYDALYQDAAEKAVQATRRKAEMITRIAQTELGEIESFTVQGPNRTGRFGPQPNLINHDKVNQIHRSPGGGVYPAVPAPYTVFNGASSAYDQVVTTGGGGSYTAQPSSRYTTIPPVYETYTEPVVVQEATTELITIPATWENVTETVVVQPAYTDPQGNFTPAVTKQQTRRVVKTPARTQERAVPAVTKLETRRRIKTPARTVENYAGGSYSGGGINPNSNALQMSLLSGPQTISVSATISYNYKTPIDGTIVPEDYERN